MAEITNDLRVTTISLDEYNRLTSEVNALRETKGALNTTITNLNVKISELQQKQPQVKVARGYKHTYHDEYDGVETNTFNEESVEFINLNEVERLADEKAKSTIKVKVEDLENKIESLKDELKRASGENEKITDQLTEKEKALTKVRAANREALSDAEETYDKNIKKLKKAIDEDVKEYKETISDLKDEIKKIKDSKTDAEVEEKRNKEIKDLKGRIKDLEKTIEELGSMNFFKRVFKLRTISAEKLAAQTELLEREKNANKVGTTWVKEDKKYRVYNKFQSVWGYVTRNGKKYPTHAVPEDNYKWIDVQTFSSLW